MSSNFRTKQWLFIENSTHGLQTVILGVFVWSVISIINNFQLIKRKNSIICIVKCDGVQNGAEESLEPALIHLISFSSSIAVTIANTPRDIKETELLEFKY